MSDTANKPTIIREKETFHSEVFINVEGVDTKFYIKCVVNYERLTFKVTPVITMIHGFDQEVQDALIESTQVCREECKSRLERYRLETGIGTQSEFAYGQPAGN